MKRGNRKRCERTINKLCRDIFDHSRRNTGPWSGLKATVTISQDSLHSDKWNWSVKFHIDYRGDEPNRSPGYGSAYWAVRSASGSGQEADTEARSVVQYAQSVYAELITTIAPPTTITIEV